MATARGGVNVPISSTWNGRGLKQAQGALGKFNKSVGILGVSLGGAAIAGGMIAFAKNAVAMARESRKTEARLDQVAKSMGVYDTVLGSTTERLTDYAQQLQNTTGISDETTKSAQAILLTFEQLALTAGDAGGMFDRATAALLDLSAVGFGDATTNAKSLGKALQDPIKGLTALGRQGITFTNTEKDKIKALVATNRTLEAQTIIMEAVEKQVGGAAAAVATDFDKLSAAADDAQELIGLALVDAMESAVRSIGGSDGLGPAMVGAAQDVADFIGGVEAGVKSLTDLTDGLESSGIGVTDMIAEVYRLTPGLGGLVQMMEMTSRSGEKQRLAEEALNDELRKSEQIRRMYTAATNNSITALDADTDATKRNVTVKERLIRAEQTLNGFNRSIMGANIRLRQLRAEGPNASGGKKGNTITADDRRRFGLDYAETVSSKAELLISEGRLKAARSVLDQGRDYLGNQVGDKFANRVLSTPRGLGNEIDRRDSMRGAERYRENTAAVYNTYNFGDLKVDSPAEAVEQAKKAARLRALSNAGASTAAPVYQNPNQGLGLIR